MTLHIKNRYGFQIGKKEVEYIKKMLGRRTLSYIANQLGFTYQTITRSVQVHELKPVIPETCENPECERTDLKIFGKLKLDIDPMYLCGACHAKMNRRGTYKKLKKAPKIRDLGLSKDGIEDIRYLYVSKLFSLQQIAKFNNIDVDDVRAVIRKKDVFERWKMKAKNNNEITTQIS